MDMVDMAFHGEDLKPVLFTDLPGQLLKAFLNAIDQPYLQGYMNLTIISSQSYDANSTANQINRIFGMNQTGSEIVRPNMYCNKYPWEKAKDLFGKVPGYGAQMPQ